MNRRAKRILIVLSALCLTAALARPSLAESRGKQSAEAHYHKGMKAYTLGRFAEAIEEFEQAYELRSEPVFLYNIAQSHRQNNSPQRAIFFYRRYLEADPEAKNRAEVEKRIKDMETQLNAKTETAAAPQAGPAPTPPPAASPPVTQPAPAAAATPTTAAAQVQAEPAPSVSSGHGLRVTGVALGAVGVVGMAAGIYFGLHANSLYGEATKPNTVYDYSKDQSSKTFRTMEWVALGVGGAAIATGAVLYYMGASRRGTSPVAITPMVAPGTGGATLFARF